MASVSGSDSEGDGEVLRLHGDPNADSSEEEEDDEEEAQRIREGFIVDEDEDVGSDAEKRRRKRRKHKKRKRAEADALDEDDLDLLMENTGTQRPATNDANRKRHKRRGSSESSQGDLPTLNEMFNDPGLLSRGRMDDPEDDMDDFIEDDEDENLDDETRAEMREQKRKAKRENAKKVRSYAGADQQTRAELEDIFGAGDEYAGALEAEETISTKQGIRMEDIFEPTEIADRYLLPEDQRIRENDIPERHQFATSTLSSNPVYAEIVDYPSLDMATNWVGSRVSNRTKPFISGMSLEGRDPERTKAEYEAAVRSGLEGLFVDKLEVPFLWRHRRDQFIDAEGQLIWLNQEELWTCYDLGLRYRAIHEKRAAVQSLYDAMKEFDPGFYDLYFEEMVLGLPDGTASQSLEAGSEALEWLDLRYPHLVRAVKEAEGHALDRKRAGGGKTRRLKHEGALGDFVEMFGLPPGTVATQIVTSSRAETSTNPDARPLDVAERYLSADQSLHTPEEVLQAGLRLLAQEFGADPFLRHHLREMVRANSYISCRPTEKGKAKIDELHMYYPFKYLLDKPVADLTSHVMFTQMLAAEAEGLITIHMDLTPDDGAKFMDSFMEAYDAKADAGDSHHELWSDLRHSIAREAFENYLLPKAWLWLKDELRQLSEDHICQHCQDQLESRVDMRPYGSKNGSSISVLALSFGRGRREAIMAVFLDGKGHIGSQTKFDSIAEQELEFKDFVQAHKPEVIVLGGFTAETHKLRAEVDNLLKNMAAQSLGYENMAQGLSSYAEQEYMSALASKQIPLIYVQDDVARLYMNSAQAIQENPSWPANARYSLGLARFVQDPLNEYCALGPDITAISYGIPAQSLVSQERLLQCLERALVNVVNAVGVDINQAVREPYLQKLLPFVAGLGPRKAEALVKNVLRHGGSLNNRKKLLADDNLPPKICVNAMGFLYIPHDQLFEADIDDSREDTEGPDPLDHSRIHPFDYELAHEMVENMLNLDPDDAKEQNPSKAVVQLWNEGEVEDRLRDLNMGEFVKEVQRRKGKLLTWLINSTARELVEPFKDMRQPFVQPSQWDVLRMLTGETPDTVDNGRVITATVMSVKQDMAFIRLDSGISGQIPIGYILNADSNSHDARDYLTKGQTIRGVISLIKPGELSAEVTIRLDDINRVRAEFAAGKRDLFFDVDAERVDQLAQEKKKGREQAKLPRRIDHPNWKVVNKVGAERLLKTAAPGDTVIRPSSQGSDHIAVTWKVDENIYQHISVQEIDKPSEPELGRVLRVENASFSDLDDLIINHVGAIFNKVEKLKNHDKYHPESQLDAHLVQQVLAHPGSSAYGFCLSSERPGWARLSFLSRAPKDGGEVQSWPVKILPGAYKLMDAEVPGMPELCNAFKMQYKARLEEQRRNPGLAQTPRVGGARTPGGRTPGLGGRTPGLGARTPGLGAGIGGRTPGLGAGVGARTPAVGYGGVGSATPMMRPGGSHTPGFRPSIPSSTYGQPGQGSTPFGNAPYGGTGSTPFGYAATPFGNSANQNPYGPPSKNNGPPPPPPPPPPPASGMNPERARMLANPSNGGWNGGR